MSAFKEPHLVNTSSGKAFMLMKNTQNDEKTIRNIKSFQHYHFMFFFQKKDVIKASKMFNPQKAKMKSSTNQRNNQIESQDNLPSTVFYGQK
ncbi:CLUMA_CG017800, isoform A [Clunio marinus]|uniref:CLUMA_CG017800, isoform A n=1 Tax=Clunio marinus TaxID=568069 RepID=A0A1J1IYW0_9DIPT|nr:CLUMA_CG017800, isoform A [Clunio marinus]